MAAFLALDLGTEGARAAVYGDQGALLGSGAEAYPTRFPRPGWAEQDPDDWWLLRSEQARRRREHEAGVAELAMQEP
ncbi:FGGY family carbohydrate kinase, partial [Nonomuraea sp. NPDC004580]|uniref:FGGY family carbohydrate kinase n=1 Tax=Nonomuraea sp. NPDC004580 TaxID=3154552 RepID=UPI0033B37892